MSARKLLDQLESQGLLDDNIISDLRRQVDESKSRINAETIAKLLVDNGHLTKFQATRLVSNATASDGSQRTSTATKSRSSSSSKTKKKSAPAEAEDLGFADDESEADEVVMLEDATAAQPASKSAPSSPSGLQPLDAAPSPANSPSGLQPLEAEPTAAPSGLQPLGAEPPPPPPAQGLQPLGGLDDMEAVDEVPKEAHKKRPKKKVNRENIWDSPLLYVGSGVLLLLLFVGWFLYYSLTLGTAEEMFEAAENDYRGGSYTQAAEKYERFLKSYPDNEKASLARVRIAMGHVRTAVEHSSDPQKGLDAAREYLPDVVSEESFDTARPELATLLPEIAKRFADRADNIKDIKQKKELLGKVDEAMELVYDPNYLSSTERKNQAVRIEDIEMLFDKVEREIGRDEKLQETVSAIRSAIDANDTSLAYSARKQLLDKYPGLETRPDLVAAVQVITAGAQQQVSTEEAGVAPLTDDHSGPAAQEIVMATYGGQTLPGADNHLTLAKVDGAVYGLDAGTGQLRWRRHVGFDTKFHPIQISREPDGDALVVDGRRHELLRLAAADGKVVWRLPLGEPINTPALSADQERVIVSTRAGRVMEIDAATGQPSVVARIPQTLETGPGTGDSRRPMIYQVAEQDNLYVLKNETLECQQVVHLGHRPGTVVVPPVMAVGHIFVAVNSQSRRSQLHVLAGNEEGLELSQAQGPIQLDGHVVTPLMVSGRGRRITVVTDLGQIAVFDIAPQKEDSDPVTPAVPPRVATFSNPTHSYSLVDNDRLWVGDNRMSRFEIQTAKGELVQQEVANQGDVFVGPLQHIARGVLELRRPRNVPGVTFRAVSDRSIEETMWFAELGVPATQVLTAGMQVFVVSARGRLYPIDSQAAQQGIARPVTKPTRDDAAVWYEFATQLPSGATVFCSRNLRMLLFDPSEPNQLRERAVAEATGEAATAPVAMGAGMLLPLTNGQVLFVDELGSALAHPFQPQLEPGETLQWRRPAVLSNDQFVIADGRRTLYLVGVETRGEKHLGMVAQQALPEEIVSPLAAAESSVFGVTRGADDDTVVTFSAPDLKAGPTLQLQGRLTWGPEQVDDAVFLTSSGDGLVCLDAAGQKRWHLPLGEDALAAAPVADEDGYLLATVGGRLLRVARSGQVTASTDIQEPLSTQPVTFNGRVLVAGSDGTLFVTALQPAAAEAAAAQ